jgi:hypothetical protein
MERSTIFNGKIHYKWPFSIAMLVYQRVYIQVLYVYGVCVWGMYADMLGHWKFDILSTSQLPKSDIFEPKTPVELVGTYHTYHGARSDSAKMPWHF